MGIDNFQDIISGGYSYGGLVRMIFHEVIHIAQKIGIGQPAMTSKYSSIDRVIHNEREFLSYYNEVTNKSLPGMFKNEKIGAILIAISDKVRRTNGEIKGNYYDLMTPEKQAEHLSKYLQLQSILKTLQKN